MPPHQTKWIRVNWAYKYYSLSWLNLNISTPNDTPVRPNVHPPRQGLSVAAAGWWAFIVRRSCLGPSSIYAVNLWKAIPARINRGKTIELSKMDSLWALWAKCEPKCSSIGSKTINWKKAITDNYGSLEEIPQQVCKSKKIDGCFGFCWSQPKINSKQNNNTPTWLVTGNLTLS